MHKKDGKTIIAACDKELKGKKFEENGIQLDLNSEFYSGEEMGEKEAGDIIRNADIVNLAGGKSVELGIKEGVIDKSNVLFVKNIPHAQAVILHEC